MLLSKILTRLCMIIHYPEEENIFAVFVYKLLVQKKYQNAILKKRRVVLRPPDYMVIELDKSFLEWS